MTLFRILFLLHFLAAMPAFGQRPPMVPADVVGAETCRECHEEMVDKWEKSAHFRSFADLATRDSTKSITSALGYDPMEITQKASCVRCHYTQEVLSGVPQSTDAVSCESCHGGAALWIEEHNTKGVSRQNRVDTSLALGMAHPSSILAISKACFECHVIDDEQLVNRGGHPAVSEGFEILSWYLGEVNHSFLIDKSGSGLKKHANDIQPMPQNRCRMLFLNGKLLHLASLLDAISRATDAPVDKSGKFIELDNGKYTYAVQLARQVKVIEADVEEVLKRVSIPQYNEALAIVRTLRFQTGNEIELKEAAESMNRLAESFCAGNDGSQFGAVDPLIEKREPRFSEVD